MTNLVKVEPLLKLFKSWKDFIREPFSEIEMEKIRRHERTGRPTGYDFFVNRLETETGGQSQKKETWPHGTRKWNNYELCLRNS